MLYTREAWGYANLGRVTAFERATDNAEEALADSRSADEPYWIGYFDQAELEGTTGGRLLELAHQDKRYAGETSERISRAVALRGAGRLRSSALDQIGLAEASLIEGGCEKAAAQGEAATAVVEQTLSDRVRVKLVELYRTSDAHASVPPLLTYVNGYAPSLLRRSRPEGPTDNVGRRGATDRRDRPHESDA